MIAVLKNRKIVTKSIPEKTLLIRLMLGGCFSKILGNSRGSHFQDSSKITKLFMFFLFACRGQYDDIF